MRIETGKAAAHSVSVDSETVNQNLIPFDGVMILSTMICEAPHNMLEFVIVQLFSLQPSVVAVGKAEAFYKCSIPSTTAPLSRATFSSSGVPIPFFR